MELIRCKNFKKNNGKKCNIESAKELAPNIKAGDKCDINCDVNDENCLADDNCNREDF